MTYHRSAVLHKEYSVVRFRVEVECEVFCRGSVVHVGYLGWCFRTSALMTVESGRDSRMILDSHMDCTRSIQHSHASDQAHVEMTKDSLGCQIKPGDNCSRSGLTSPRIVPGSSARAIDWPGQIRLVSFFQVGSPPCS
jgi:hypothetical protein